MNSTSTVENGDIVALVSPASENIKIKHAGSEHLVHIGGNIRRHRKSRKWTQEEMANKAGLSRIALIHIESSKAIPTLETLDSLARVLDIAMPTLMLKPIASDSVDADSLSGESLNSELATLVDALRKLPLSQVIGVRRVVDTIVLMMSENSLMTRHALGVDRLA